VTEECEKLKSLLVEGMSLLDRKSGAKELKAWWWKLCFALRSLIAILKDESETLRIDDD